MWCSFVLPIIGSYTHFVYYGIRIGQFLSLIKSPVGTALTQRAINKLVLGHRWQAQAGGLVDVQTQHEEPHTEERYKT
jgi:hypothetical protein